MVIDTSKGISIKQYGKVSHQKGNWHDGRTLPYHLILFVETGSFKMRIGQKVVVCSEKDLIFIPKDTYYRPLDSQGVSYYFFQINADLPSESQNDTNVVLCSKYDKKMVLPNSDTEIESHNFNYFRMNSSSLINIETPTHCLDNVPIQKIISRIASLDIKYNNNNILLAEAYLREILILASNELHENCYNKKLHDILRFINMNYHEKLSLSGISKMFAVSESYVARLFKQQLGTTLSDYINLIRIQAACDYLCNTKMKIGDIAYKTGFNNPYYFSRVFRKIHGITPGQYRKKESFNNP